MIAQMTFVATHNKSSLETTTITTQRDEAKAFSLCLQAAKFGDVDAMYSVSCFFESGIGCDPDPAQASVSFLLWVEREKRITTECTFSCVTLFVWILQSLFHEDANNGDPQAQHHIGIMLDEGRGVNQDEVSQQSLDHTNTHSKS